MNKKSLAVIGGGDWGKNLIRDFHQLNVLHSICDINTDLQKQYHNQYPDVKVTGDFRSILDNQDITQVVIALPAELHYKFSKQALIHNKDVFLEKPMTLNLADAEELVQLAKENGRVLMVGHILHYHAAMLIIIKMITLKKILNGKTNTVFISHLVDIIIICHMKKFTLMMN